MFYLQIVNIYKLFSVRYLCRVLWAAYLFYIKFENLVGILVILKESILAVIFDRHFFKIPFHPSEQKKKYFLVSFPSLLSLFRPISFVSLFQSKIKLNFFVKKIVLFKVFSLKPYHYHCQIRHSYSIIQFIQMVFHQILF